MTKLKDAATAHAEIERLAKEKAVQEVRFIKAAKVGRCTARQGDIYIHAVATSHPHGALRKGKDARQLAVGNTQGSRHIAEAPAKVYEGTALPKYANARTFIGPCIKSDERFVVTHPEHAYVSLPAGTYQITHQMDARTLSRVQD